MFNINGSNNSQLTFKIVLSFITFLFITNVNAQERIGQWSGQFDIGGALTNGNTDTSRLDAEINIRYIKGRVEDNLRIVGAFSKDNSNTTEQRFLITYESYLEIKKDLFGFSFVKFDDDSFSGFDHEIEASIGSGYKIINKENIRILMQGGPGYRISKQSKESSQNLLESNFLSKTVTLRGNIKLEYEISKDLILANNFSVTWDKERTRIDENISITNTLISNISTRVSFNIRYNSNPPNLRKRNDKNTKISLVYNF